MAAEGSPDCGTEFTKRPYDAGSEQFSQAHNGNANNGVPQISSHQRSLLAGFGVIQPNFPLNTRHLMSEHSEKVINGKRQDFSARRVLDQPGPTPAPFHPANIHLHNSQNILQQRQILNMASSGFDPRKYGAPPRRLRMRPTVSVSQDQTEATQATSGVQAEPLSEITAATGHGRGSDPLAQRNGSESSHSDAIPQAHSANASKSVKYIGAVPLKSKSVNRIIIPGFDHTKYGKPKPELGQNIIQDEHKMVSSSTASQGLLTNKFNTESSPVPPEDSAAPGTLESQLPRNVLVNHGNTISPQEPDQDQVQPHKDQDKALASPSDTELSFKQSQPATRPNQFQNRTPQMIPASIPPPDPNISKEARLKQVQDAKLREIALQNRKKNKVKPSSTKHSQDIQPSVTAEIPSPSPTANEMTTNDVTTNSTPPAAPSHPERINNKLPTRSPSTMLPAGMTKHELLGQVQAASLREIAFRNRMNTDDPETTSLRDLQIARTPITGGSVSTSAPVSEFNQTSGRNTPPTLPPQDGAIVQTSVTGSATADASTKKDRSSRWCNKAELKPVENLETNSNTWGSEIPSNASVASNDSITPMQLHGKLFRGPPADDHDELRALIGWDGKMQPPPVDWNDRPRFNNNSPAFKNSFNNWFTTAVAANIEIVDDSPTFRRIPSHVVQSIDWQPDGIGMVRKEYTLDPHNVSKYGYDIEPADVAKYALPIEAMDFEDWGKLDLRDHQNQAYKDETTEMLVTNWIAHQEQNLKKPTTLTAIHNNSATIVKSQPEILKAKTSKPSVNIYLRPAARADMSQLTNLYNWWVEKSPRTVELSRIEVADMRARFDNAVQDRLPFVVAILKGKKDLPRDNYTGINGEQIVGFTTATCFTCIDYVEHITVELEMYVHPNYVRQGIGRCLLDRILCATDRGHMERGGYSFHCDAYFRHWYEVGGARNLHKLVFMARHYSRPKKDAREETDVSTWLKDWLVGEFDFEHEATLKQTGAKNGRFIDTTYFCKFTKWLPDEGIVPDPEPKDLRPHPGTVS